jgi:hypothetical protein
LRWPQYKAGEASKELAAALTELPLQPVARRGAQAPPVLRVCYAIALVQFISARALSPDSAAPQQAVAGAG